jgi:hypothetical protein
VLRRDELKSGTIAYLAGVAVAAVEISPIYRHAALNRPTLSFGWLRKILPGHEPDFSWYDHGDLIVYFSIVAYLVLPHVATVFSVVRHRLSRKQLVLAALLVAALMWGSSTAPAAIFGTSMNPGSTFCRMASECRVGCLGGCFSIEPWIEIQFVLECRDPRRYHCECKYNRCTGAWNQTPPN